MGIILGATLGYWIGGNVGATRRYWVGVFVGESRRDVRSLCCWGAMSELGWICVLVLSNCEWRLMRLCNVIVNCLKSRMVVLPFQPLIPLTVCCRFSMARMTQYAWVMVGLVMCLC